MCIRDRDGIVFTLPKSARPKKHVLRVQGTGTGSGTVIIVAKGGPIGSGLALPAGTVYWTGDPTFGLLLDGVSFPASTTKVFGRATASGKTTADGAALLKRLGIR